MSDSYGVVIVSAPGTFCIIPIEDIAYIHKVSIPYKYTIRYIYDYDVDIVYVKIRGCQFEMET